MDTSRNNAAETARYQSAQVKCFLKTCRIYPVLINANQKKAYEESIKAAFLQAGFGHNANASPGGGTASALNATGYGPGGKAGEASGNE